MKLLFISFEEGFLISLIALILFGPNKIPEIARDFGNWIRTLKIIIEKIKNELFQQNINQSLTESKKNNLSKSIKR